MTALAADANILSKTPGLKAYGVAANVVIYKGALVCVNTAGYLIPADSTAGNVCVGVAHEKVDNTTVGNVAGGKLCRVQHQRHFLLTGAALVQGNVGKTANVLDSGTIQVGAGTIAAGTVTELVSATQAYVYIN